MSIAAVSLNLSLFFPTLTTPFSFKPLAQSPHSQSSRVLDLELTNNAAKVKDVIYLRTLTPSVVPRSR